MWQEIVLFIYFRCHEFELTSCSLFWKMCNVKWQWELSSKSLKNCAMWNDSGNCLQKVWKMCDVKWQWKTIFKKFDKCAMWNDSGNCPQKKVKEGNYPQCVWQTCNFNWQIETCLTKLMWSDRSKRSHKYWQMFIVNLQI